MKKIELERENAKEMKKVDEFERRSKGVTSNWEDGSNLGRSGRRVGGD